MEMGELRYNGKLYSPMRKARLHGTQSHVGNGNPIYNTNAVKVVDREYLYKDFVAKKKEDRSHIDDIVQEFTLNEEQERAFKIIANHSVYDAADQLKMYIGGMAGTGKSQVIKALIKFFERKQQSFVFLIMAPTGSAAALVSGSTYHSVLGINGYQANESIKT